MYHQAAVYHPPHLLFVITAIRNRVCFMLGSCCHVRTQRGKWRRELMSLSQLLSRPRCRGAVLIFTLGSRRALCLVRTQRRRGERVCLTELSYRYTVKPCLSSAGPKDLDPPFESPLGHQAQLWGRKLLVSIYFYHGLLRHRDTSRVCSLPALYSLSIFSLPLLISVLFSLNLAVYFEIFGFS
jgi:hypothetical protein